MDGSQAAGEGASSIGTLRARQIEPSSFFQLLMRKLYMKVDFVFHRVIFVSSGATNLFNNFALLIRSK